MQGRRHPFLQKDGAKERKTAWQANAGLIIASTYSFVWMVHKDRDLILKLFHTGLLMGPQRDKTDKILNNGNNLGVPEAVSQLLVKAKNGVYGKFKGKQFYWGQENVVLKSPVVCFKTILEGIGLTVLQPIFQSTTFLSIFKILQNI